MKTAINDFRVIIRSSVIENEGGAEYVIALDSEDFYFRYHFEKEVITDHGMHDLDGEQMEALISKMRKRYETDLEELEPDMDGFNPLDYYREYGLNEAMFI